MGQPSLDPRSPYQQPQGQQRRPPRTSLTGPVVLTGAGVLTLVLAAAAAVVVVRMFLAMAPIGVVDRSGEPASDVLAVVDAPGTVVTDLPVGYYQLYVVAPSRTYDVLLEGSTELTAPDGTTIVLDDGPAVASRADLGGTTALAVLGFQVDEPGEYTLRVPAATDPDARVVVAESPDVGAFLGGTFATVGATLVALALGAVGFCLTVGGGIWWTLRVRARKAQPC